MALKLVWAGTLYVNAWCRGEPDHAIEEMPPVVQPFAQRKQWMDAHEQAAMRLVRRLEKGMKPQPNCTGTAQDNCDCTVGDAAQCCCGQPL
jgi:hypothetical protein